MCIILLISLLAGLELNLHRHMLSQKKKLSQLRSLFYDFEIFKEMSHILELLSFQKMYAYGLLWFIRKMKALQWFARTVLKGG